MTRGYAPVVDASLLGVEVDAYHYNWKATGVEFLIVVVMSDLC